MARFWNIWRRERQVQRLAKAVFCHWSVLGCFAELSPLSRFHLAQIWAHAFRVGLELHNCQKTAERAAGLAVQAVLDNDNIFALEGKPMWQSLLEV